MPRKDNYDDEVESVREPTPQRKAPQQEDSSIQLVTENQLLNMKLDHMDMKIDHIISLVKDND
jgi:hypothetical protein